jgi:hypothetical protein
MINANRKQFEHSAQTKRDAAHHLICGTSKHPAPALYLSHVSLECALKLRILKTNGAIHINDLKKLLPEKTFEGLFNGATGHDLHHLAKTASIDRMLVATGNEALLEQPEWRAMSGDRPYSLRYGTETVSAASARHQIDLAVRIADLILKGAV